MEQSLDLEQIDKSGRSLSGELTLEESQKLQQHLDNYLQPYLYNNQQDTEGSILALQDILRLGRRALPEIKNILLINSERTEHSLPLQRFVYSTLLYELAEKEDLEQVMSFISDEPDLLNGYNNATVNLAAMTASRILYELRIENSNNPLLEQVSDKLITQISKSEVSRSSSLLLFAPLALTGSNDAANFITKKLWITSPEEVQKYTKIVDDITAFEDDVNSPFFPEDAYLFDYDREVAMAESTDKIVVNEAAEIPRYQEIPDEELEIICKKTLTILERFKENGTSLEINPPSEAALRLYCLNTIIENPTIYDYDLLKNLARLSTMLIAENEAKKHKDLPTIGFEVESPKDLHPSWSYGWPILKMLNDTGFELSDENLSSEITTPPSYSVAVQNRIMLELRRIGIIPLDKRFASLHISLGVPNDGEDHLLATEISNLLTYAYVPDGRIRSRQHYESSYNYHSDENDKVDPDEDGEDINIARYEFRTPRIVGSKTYRLLSQVQEIGTLLGTNDPTFYPLKQTFVQDVEKLRREYGLGIYATTTEDGKEEIADMVKDAYAKWQMGLADAVEGITDLDERKRVISRFIQGDRPNLIQDARKMMNYYTKSIRAFREKMAETPPGDYSI